MGTRKTEKIITTKVMMANVAIDMLGLVMLVFVLATIKMVYGVIVEEKVYTCVFMLAIYFLIANLLLPRILTPILEKQKEEEKSKKVVEEQLSRDFTEVIPINAVHYYSFIVHHLTRIAQFYAILDEEDMIRIYVKINLETDKTYFEKIPKSKFTFYYKLKNINIE